MMNAVSKKIEEQITKLFESYHLFDCNNEETRNMFFDQTSGLMNDLKENGLVEDVFVVCDETNNTSKESLRADIYYKSKRISDNKFIQLTVEVKTVGIEFQDIVGRK